MDHAASDVQIDHAGGMTDGEETEGDGTVVARVDTLDGSLAALGHVLERRRAVPAGTASPGLDSASAVRWRLALHREVPTTVPGGDDPIELWGPADGCVPRVLETLLAGVTRGQPLVPVHPADGIERFERVDPLGRRGGRPPRRRTSVLDVERAHVPVDATIEHSVRAIAVRAARTLIALDPHLRLDALPDDVHEARIAVRRIRSELHAMDHLLRPGRTERLRAELIWFGGVLGAVRDLDVVLEHLPDASNSGDDGTRLIRMRARSQRRVAALVLRNSLASRRVRGLYDELLELAADPWLAKGVDPHRKARRAALEAVRITDRRLAGAVRSIGESFDAERLLEVRRRAKACRHVCELVAEPLGSGRLADAMLGLQMALGSLQDAVIIDAWLAASHCPPLDPAAGVAVSVLATRAAEQRETALSEWPSAWVRAQADALRPWTA